MPMPAPVAASTPRRDNPVGAGGALSPALLCASGFSSHGISVRTSPSATLALSPYLMSGSLIAMCNRIEPMTT